MPLHPVKIETVSRVLLILLPVVISASVAFAQPDPAAPGMAANPPEQIDPPTGNTPENAVRKFVADLDGNLEIGLAADVAGARVGFYGTEDWEWAFNNFPEMRRIKKLKIDGVKVENQSENEATVSLTTHQERRVGDQVQRTDPTTVTLQLQHTADVPGPAFPFLKTAWRIVPLSTDEFLASPLDKISPFQLAATIAVRDPRLLPFIRQQRAMTQLKQLAIGIMQIDQDYDDFLAFDDAGYGRALLPYLKDATYYTIAGTTNEKWHFNDNLSSLGLAAIKEPTRTVLFYDGSAPDNDHLNFRFSDKTLVCFADGHVVALSKDELKDLTWKP